MNDKEKYSMIDRMAVAFCAALFGGLAVLVACLMTLLLFGGQLGLTFDTNWLTWRIPLIMALGCAIIAVIDPKTTADVIGEMWAGILNVLGKS